MQERIQEKLLEVRLIEKKEVKEWGSYLQQYHYLGYNWIPGENLRYIATLDGEWIACLGWGSAALKCKVRDEYISWNEEKKLKRLYLITNNVRFLIMPWVQIKNIASAILSLNLRRISDDYAMVYGHPVYLAETFVDASKYRGTCYKASNWQYLGETSGYSKSGRHYYQNDNPKSVFVYPLSKRAKEMLNSKYLSKGSEKMKEHEILSMNDFPVHGLMEAISRTTDPRKKRGIRHKIVSILALSVCAVLCGARSYLAIGEWAKGLTKDVLKRFDCDRGIAPSGSFPP
jgi:Druantia protein DruA/DDE_Tnp_1-associated